MATSARHLRSGAALFGLGAATMYLLDPQAGRRRRARIRDQGRHLMRVERALLGKAQRDLGNRARGTVEHLRHPTRTDVDGTVIAERVRAHVGRVVSHPGSIDVDVTDGRVTLSGPILAPEVPELFRCVEGIPGVREVVDQLDKRERPGDVPGLQGAGKPPRNGRELWPPSPRVIVTGLGAHRARRGTLGKLAGSALLLRAAFNRPWGRIVGAGRYAVDVQKSIAVDAPIEEVSALWSHFEGFPQFMQHVQSVEVDADRRISHWRVDGPGGTTIAFDAEVTRSEPGKLIAWKTLPNQPVEHTGTVRFEPAPFGTRVHVQMRYSPPLGAIGHTVARLFGWDPKTRMDDDLVRMKSLLEHGRTRAHGHRVTIAELDGGTTEASSIE